MVELGTVVAAVADAATKKAIDKSTASLVDKISFKIVKGKYDEIKLLLDRGLPKYLEANYAKCETLKTLLNRNDPVALEECFVAPDFELKGISTSSDEFLDKVHLSNTNVVITGLAGSGKSVFLKYAFRKVIERRHTYYPIFFELRSLNREEKTKGLLLSKLFDSVHECCESFTRAQFNYGLKCGAFYFLLDGYDELHQDIREQISSEINALARNNGKCAIVITSRPSDEFVSWEGFSEAKLMPFDLEKVTEYINRLKFDEEKKSDFLADLEAGNFESNEDFLSNPLLSAMMLLTYDSFGEIPEKRHIFYSKCFDVLAREHDASKGRYKRELFSTLSIDQIERAFMFFCALSYGERIFSFSDQQMVDFVENALASCGIDADVTDVITDFRESISIIERVGLLYEFAHRSFQEYFYAKFVTIDRKIPLERKVKWLTSDFRSDDTIEMIADMDRTYFEDEFLLPNVSRLVKRFSGVDPMTNPSGVLSKFFSRVHTSDSFGKEQREFARSYGYTHGEISEVFFMHQALTKYLDSYREKLEENLADRELPHEEVVAILDNDFEGEIKIHHSNNAKLLKVESHHFANRIKNGIEHLHEHLQKKQEQRKHGISGLIKKKYQ